MSKNPRGPRDPDDEITDKVVIPFRRRWKSGSGEPPQTLADGTVVESMGRGWANWLFKGYPVVQNTCVACLRQRRQEHEACGFEDCDCFCTVGKLWPLWALFGLAPPEGEPVPPQLLRVGPQKDAEQEQKAEDAARSARRRVLRPGASLAALVLAVLVLGSGGVALLKHTACGPYRWGPGDGELTGGGGVAEESANSGQRTSLPPWLRALSSGGSTMGEKAPPERYIPNEPLEGQKRAPCDPGIGEDTINGGCWDPSVHVKPPCGRLYRSGDTCYRPIAADPNKPFSGGPQPSPVPTREQPGPIQEMPGKEQ